jgi:hypothetical protein
MPGHVLDLSPTLVIQWSGGRGVEKLVSGSHGTLGRGPVEEAIVSYGNTSDCVCKLILQTDSVSSDFRIKIKLEIKNKTINFIRYHKLYRTK